MAVLPSLLLGQLDYAYASTKRDGRFFAKGWDWTAIAQADELATILSEQGSLEFPDIQDLGVDEIVSVKKDHETCFGSFLSPCASYLPRESEHAHVLIVAPLKSARVRGVLVLVAGTGEISYWRRRDLVARPLAKRGYVSLILQSPFYGRRKPADQRSFFITSVGNYLLQMPATTLEVAKLAKFATRAWPGVPVGLAGSSLGGSIAAAAYPSVVAELAAVRAGDPEPSAGTPIALCTFLPPSRTTSVFNSVISFFMEYRSLCRDKDGFRTVRDVKARLLEHFARHELGRYYSFLQTSDRVHSAFTCIRALHDRFVRPSEVSLAHEIVLPHVATSRLISVSGGHVWNILRTHKVVPPAILETFRRLLDRDLDVPHAHASASQERSSLASKVDLEEARAVLAAGL